MALDIALSNASSGLNASQQLITNAASNISNYKTENYVRKEVEFVSAVDGVKIAGISRKIDQYLEASIISQTSNVSYAKTINDYNNEIQLLFGTPDTGDTLDFSINEFFSSLKSLSNNPELDSMRLNVMNKAQSLSTKISNISYGLQNLRNEADKDINLAADFVNEQLHSIHMFNQAIVASSEISSAHTDLLQNRDNILRSLAEKLNVSVFYRPNNQVLVNTSQGLPLVSHSNYILDYTPAGSVTSFVNNFPISDLTSYQLDTQGEKFDENILIRAGTGELAGTKSTISTVLETGEIAALKELRDNTIPLIIDQLDNLAFAFTNEFNKIHNSGSGFPALDTLTGTREILLDDNKSFSGQVRIGLIDKGGNPIAKTNGENLNPLLLNLSTLSSANIPGKFNIQTLIDEINQYFYINPTLTTTSLGNIDDIKIVAKSPLSTTPNGIFTFDFELENNSQLNSSFEILSLNVTDPACVGLVGTLPNAYNSLAGTKLRTDSPITVDFSVGAGGPYNLQAEIKIIDSRGNISTSVINYQINDNPADSDIQNNRYIADHVISGDALVNPASNVTRYAYASLVDENGNPPNSNENGYLQIKSLNDNFFISIDDLNSAEIGLAATSTSQMVPPTNKGFSEYFELNDFFVRNSNADQRTNNSLIAGSAINLSIRNDIVKNPNLLSLGKLTQDQSYHETSIVGDRAASGSIKFSSNPSINDEITINGTIFTFVTLSSAPDEITIAPTLALTLDNIKDSLNAINATTKGTVDLAVYDDNSVDTLYINFKNSGISGNNFKINANLASIDASINNNILSHNPTGFLFSGTDKEITELVTPWSYSIGVGNNSVVTELANLSDMSITFNAAGGLSATTDNVTNYIATIISYRATAANSAANAEEQQTLLFDAYNEKMKATTGVNIDQELINITQYQTYYSASAKIISIVKGLYDELLHILN